jgi:phosphate transport system substrate-binding protein
MQGKPQTTVNGLVFDNPNSYRALYEGVGWYRRVAQEEVYSFKVNKDVVKFISENDGMIGVVGLNWLYQRHLT